MKGHKRPNNAKATNITPERKNAQDTKYTIFNERCGNSW